MIPLLRPFRSKLPFRSCFYSFKPPRNSARFAHSENVNVPSIYKPKRDPWISPSMILIGIIPLFTFALGTWQLKRLKWKVNLIDELEEKLQLQPLALPKRINLSVIPEFVFRKVIMRGRWDHEHIILLSPRVREGVHGTHVIMPLIRENGTTILVDRGFISNEHIHDILLLKEEGDVEVLGMLRTSQPRNRFTPNNLPTEGKWFWIDVEGMAEWAGGAKANVQPVFVEQIFEGHAGDAALCVEKGIPVGRPATVDLRNAHLSYVITWYGLSALTTFMFVRVLLKKKKMQGRSLPRYT